MGANPKYLGNNEEFIAIPELARTDAKVTLNFLLENGVRYLEPVNDPWFKAIDPVLSTDQSLHGALQYNKLWSRRAPVGVLGCASQMQFVSTPYPELSYAAVFKCRYDLPK